jgi:hypothetical protein
LAYASRYPTDPISKLAKAASTKKFPVNSSYEDYEQFFEVTKAPPKVFEVLKEAFVKYRPIVLE